jgi:hypothetical protein
LAKRSGGVSMSAAIAFCNKETSALFFCHPMALFDASQGSRARRLFTSENNAFYTCSLCSDGGYNYFKLSAHKHLDQASTCCSPILSFRLRCGRYQSLGPE